MNIVSNLYLWGVLKYFRDFFKFLGKRVFIRIFLERGLYVVRKKLELFGGEGKLRFFFMWYMLVLESIKLFFLKI